MFFIRQHQTAGPCCAAVREASQVGLSILRMEELGVERGRCWCCSRGLEVHVTTGARLFGPGRAMAAGRVPVHTGTLTTCHFPTAGREGGNQGERDTEGWNEHKRREKWDNKRRSE